MTAPQHTAGEWVFDSGRHGWWEIRSAVDGCVLAGRNPYETRAAEMNANGRLMAASPAMYAALAQVVAEGECYCADHVADTSPCGWCAAKAALARAERGE